MHIETQPAILSDSWIAEAKAIGDTILDSSIKDADGIYWTILDHEEKIENNISLYNGNSGTLFFLLELYNATKDDKYLDAVKLGVTWLLQHKEIYHQNNIAYYCGNGGFIHILLMLSNITKDKGYAALALNIAKESNSKGYISDILYGSAGSILTLLYLHNETEDDWALNAIYEKINDLLNDMIVTEKGLCWDRTGNSIHPLCGFAHGASGIAFVFLELYRYLGNEVFYKIAEMTFAYEDQYFSKGTTLPQERNNWPDLRKDIYTEDAMNKLIDAYKRNDTAEFTSLTFMSAWCHGAPGIGLSRLHAYSIKKDKKYLEDFECAVENTIDGLRRNLMNYTLCHGALGNVTLLLDGYYALGKEEYYEAAVQQAQKCLAEKNNHGFWISGISRTGAKADCDLLNGIAGIGQFFLRLARPSQSGSILAPVINEIKAKVAIPSYYDELLLSNHILRKILPNTSLQISNITSVATLSEIERMTHQEIVDMAEKKIFEQATNKSATELIHALSLDKMTLQIAATIESDNYFYIRNHCAQLKQKEYNFNSMSFTDLLDADIKASPTLVLLMQNAGHYKKYIAMQISYNNAHVDQYILGAYSFYLLDKLRATGNIKEAHQYLKDNFLSNNLLNFNKTFAANVKNYIQKGLLVLN